MRLLLYTLLVTALALPGISLADCSDGSCIPGRGPASKDCHAEYSGTGLILNFPWDLPTRTRPKKMLRCFDGDPGCDLDGQVNGSCRFNVDLCLFNSDPNLTECTPSEVTAVVVTSKQLPGAASTLQTAVDALLPAASSSCTLDNEIDLALGVKPNGSPRKSRGVIVVKATTAVGKDLDRLVLMCIPRPWPNHGYSRENHRATPQETILTTANVADLKFKWDFPLNGGVTATPVVTDRFLYASSWDGFIYAIKRKSGRLKWKHDTQSQNILGVQSTVTALADDRVVVGDSSGRVYALDGKKGTLLWEKLVGDRKSCINPTDPLLFCEDDTDCGTTALCSGSSCLTDPNTPCTDDTDCSETGSCQGIDHIWGAPTVANNRVFVGIASHSDQPCTQGRVVALDLDTGDELWQLDTVPDRICSGDTTIECTDDNDCGFFGPCIRARGAGVTATVAVDPTGEFIYMSTVGCFTFPSVGDSDTTFKIEAATGSVVWKTRIDLPEQFNIIGFYNDFGALNGPMLVDSGGQTLVITGGKNGELTAMAEPNGAIVWENKLVPRPISPNFAGFGIFNGGIGYADDRIHAALYQFAISTPPTPPVHFQSFNIADGATIDTDEIDLSWSNVGLANGVVFTGTNTAVEVSEGIFQSKFYAYDAATLTPLATFDLPPDAAGFNFTTSGVTVLDGWVYVGYGVFGPSGGVRAYRIQ